MIDFNYTEEQNGIITFVNEKGEAVKRYKLSELENYVTNRFLNLSYEHIEGENGEQKEVEVYEPVNEYIDREWDVLTKNFYMTANPSEYQSANRIQDTRKALR